MEAEDGKEVEDYTVVLDNKKIKLRAKIYNLEGHPQG